MNLGGKVMKHKPLVSGKGDEGWWRVMKGDKKAIPHGLVRSENAIKPCRPLAILNSPRLMSLYLPWDRAGLSNKVGCCLLKKICSWKQLFWVQIPRSASFWNSFSIFLMQLKDPSPITFCGNQHTQSPPATKNSMSKKNLFSSSQHSAKSPSEQTKWRQRQQSNGS